MRNDKVHRISAMALFLKTAFLVKLVCWSVSLALLILRSRYFFRRIARIMFMLISTRAVSKSRIKLAENIKIAKI